MTTSLQSLSSSSDFLGLNNSIQKVPECLRARRVCILFLSTQGPVSLYLSLLYAAHVFTHIRLPPHVYLIQRGLFHFKCHSLSYHLLSLTQPQSD